MRGTACFIGGILLVFLKWPFIGMIVETFGFLNLFGWVFCTIVGYHVGSPCLHRDFFPVILTFLRQLPFIGNLLNMPYVREVSRHQAFIFRD
jgi:hypothetical protein